MKTIGRVITNQVIDSAGKIYVFSRSYDVQSIVELGGKPAYVTTKIQEKRLDGSLEYLVIANPLVKEYIPKNESAISLSHYELECGCKHPDVEVCDSCKHLIGDYYGDEIPY